MADTAYILAQDIDTSSCKAVLFTADGGVVGRNTVSYSPQSSGQGWSWQSPHLWWDAFCVNCRVLLASIPAQAVRAVSLCGHMMSCLPVDGSGTPLCDCITWTDRRSLEEVKEIDALVGAERIHRVTGSCLSYSFSLSKVLWLKKHRPDLYRRTFRFLQCKDYVNFKLTGEMVTDETDAGFTQMYDLFRRRWSDSILQAVGLDRDKLPEVVPTGTVLGRVTPQAAAQCGLDPGTLVVQGLGDGRAPAVGAGLDQPGEGCVYLGATAWISQVTQSPEMDLDHALTKGCYLRPGRYVNGGAIFSGRLCADWFLDTFFPRRRETQGLEGFLAGQLPGSPPGSNGLLFMPYLRGERSPWWNSCAKGGFVGLTAGHTQADFCRSIVEGVSFQLAIILHRIEQLEPFTRLCLMGDQCSLPWQQILSDVMEMDIVRSDASGDASCVGAAVAAGVGAGLFSDYGAAARFHHDQYITTPIPENMELYRELLPAFEDCYYALQDINQHLGQVRRSGPDGAGGVREERAP